MAPPDPSITRIDGPWRHRDVHANGIRFHIAEAGTADGPDDATSAPLVLLLHGFGSFWWSWRHQLRGLTGVRVVAVDLRGYGGSDKPPRGYDGWTLAGDVTGLIRALGHSSAILVGHADGGLICWATAVLHRRLVAAVAVISSPHPAALRRSLFSHAGQRRALLPTLLGYQLPLWPERRLTGDHGAEIERLVRSRAGARWLATDDAGQTLAHLRRAIQIPGAAHSALEYQRWAVRTQLRDEGRRFMAAMDGQIPVPMLHLRGDTDPYVLADPVDRTRRYAPHGHYVSVAGAGHFAHEEAPAVVNDHLQRFIDERLGHR